MKQQEQFVPYVFDEMPMRKEAHGCLKREVLVFDEIRVGGGGTRVRDDDQCRRHVDASDVLVGANFHAASNYSSGKDETNATRLAVRKLMETEVTNSKLKEESAASDEELNVEKWDTDTEDSIGTSGDPTALLDLAASAVDGDITRLINIKDAVSDSYKEHACGPMTNEYDDREYKTSTIQFTDKESMEDATITGDEVHEVGETQEIKEMEVQKLIRKAELVKPIGNSDESVVKGNLELEWLGTTPDAESVNIALETSFLEDDGIGVMEGVRELKPEGITLDSQLGSVSNLQARNEIAAQPANEETLYIAGKENLILEFELLEPDRLTEIMVVNVLEVEGLVTYLDGPYMVIAPLSTLPNWANEVISKAQLEDTEEKRRVIIYASDWNPRKDLQAMNRCHRIGQSRPVHVYRLITSQYVEGRTLKRAFGRLKLEHVVIGQGQFQQDMVKPQTLEGEDLLALLRKEEDDVSKNLVLACVQKLQELNSAVLISTMTRTLSREQFDDFQAVVFTDISLGKAIQFGIGYLHEGFNIDKDILKMFVGGRIKGCISSSSMYWGKTIPVHLVAVMVWDPCGTFVLYSLLCWHAKVGLLPNYGIEDELSPYKIGSLYEDKGKCNAQTVIGKNS